MRPGRGRNPPSLFIAMNTLIACVWGCGRMDKTPLPDILCRLCQGERKMETRSMKNLAVLGIAVFMLVGCAKYLWVKPGGTQGEFSQDRYACMQEAQQRVSGTIVTEYKGTSVGVSQNNVETNDNLFRACMNARGWYLQRQDRPVEGVKAIQSPSVPIDVAALTERAKAQRAKQWIRYAKDTKGNSFYYEPASLRSKETGPTVREQVIFAENNAKFSYMWFLREIDCKNRAVRITDIIAVDKDGQAVAPPQSRKENGWTYLTKVP
jgi:hypothetical protein